MSRTNPIRDSVSVDLTLTDYVSSNGFNGVYIGGTGNLAIVTPSGSTQLYQNLAPGIYHPIQGRSILKAGTTVTGIVVGVS